MDQEGNKVSINLSNTIGESQYKNRSTGTATGTGTETQTKGRRNSNSRTSSRRNIRAKVVRNRNSIYGKAPRKQVEKPQSIPNLIINTVFRLTIVGVGMGTLFGTFLANRDLTKPLFPKVDINNLPLLGKYFPDGDTTPTDPITSTEDPVAVQENTREESPLQTSKTVVNVPQGEDSKNTINFSREDAALKEKIEKLKTKYPGLELSAFFVDLDNGVFVNSNGIKSFPAASTIKVPVLVAFLEDVDAGKIYLDEKLKVTEKNKVSGSGGMQYQGLNREYSAIYTATEMIISSDNTATEMIIERLGGKDKLNERFKEWGLENTVINNLLPDLPGTNTTSSRDLTILMAKINEGQLLSLRSRDRLMDIMTRTKTRTLLPQGLESGAMIAHKTGDIGKMLGDTGIIDMPTGKRYVGTVLVMRPYNDIKGRLIIQDVSRTVYQHFKWYEPRSKN